MPRVIVLRDNRKCAGMPTVRCRQGRILLLVRHT